MNSNPLVYNGLVKTMKPFLSCADSSSGSGRDLDEQEADDGAEPGDADAARLDGRLQPGAQHPAAGKFLFNLFIKSI